MFKDKETKFTVQELNDFVEGIDWSEINSDKDDREMKKKRKFYNEELIPLNM